MSKQGLYTAGLRAKCEALRQWGERHSIVVASYDMTRGCADRWECTECGVVIPAIGYFWCVTSFPHKATCILHKKEK